MNVRKALYIALGCIGLVIGAIGVVVPMLPAFPFLLVAAFGFARGSERLHAWFIGTRLYKENLESYVQTRAMTRKSKMRVMGMVTMLIGVSMAILAMWKLYWVWIVLGIIWLIHVLYFIFGIKTLEPEI